MRRKVNTRKSIISFLAIIDEDINLFSIIFPYHHIDFQGGLKYLWFYINPNDYKKRDWDWLVSKVEKRLIVWCNRWLSHGGNVIPIKSVIETIPIYWITLAFILKGILDKLRIIRYTVLWLRSMKKCWPSTKFWGNFGQL
jgi:hypothetical protein